MIDLIAVTAGGLLMLTLILGSLRALADRLNNHWETKTLPRPFWHRRTYQPPPPEPTPTRPPYDWSIE